MGRDKVIGAALLAVSLAIIVIYIWLVWCPPSEGLDILMLKLTGTAAVVVLFGIVAWIGYTLVTTAPPKPIEEIEKEIQQELKKLKKGEGQG